MLLRINKQIILLFVLFTRINANAQTFSGGGGQIIDNATVTFNINVSSLGASQLDANYGLEQICLNATHTYDADLIVNLESPDGTEITLFSGIGDGDDNFTNTCLNSNATSSILAQNAPFTGTFKPFTNLSNLNNGQTGIGIWKLKITDTYPADDGTLLNWSITFSNNPAPIMSFTSSNLPIIVINTNGQQIVDDPKIQVDMGVIYNGPGNINHITDTFNNYNGNAGIEIRGSSSQMFPKKTYGLELWTPAGTDTSLSLIDLPAESDWILNANYSDKTLLRNTLAYNFARKMGNYSSRTRHCELVINGNYMGVYILMEKIKRDANRVDISKLTINDNSGADVTGGYIIKIDKTTGSGGAGFLSSYPPIASGSGQTINYLYEYPSDADITPAQQTYIQNYVDSFENALASPTFNDPVNGYAKYIDVLSFIDLFLVNEVAKNVDGYRISTYLHKKKITEGGKLFAGPVWDYDIAFRNANYCEGSLYTGWAYQFGNVCPGDSWQIPFWWPRFMQDNNFTALLKCRWLELRGTIFNNAYIANYTDSVSNYLADAQIRNFDTWPILGAYVWPNPNPIASSYSGEIISLKTWLQNRINWLDNNMPGQCVTTGNFDNYLNNIMVAPIPFDEVFVISGLPSNPLNIFIYDTYGKLINSFKTSKPSEQVNTKTLSSGCYFMHIKDDKGYTRIIKLVK
ncbi:MAG TPA: CotH kinase family protein [Bacteroidia bacterium]|nr:CotH kinase family protein [Bacteroidia bacterium]